MSKTFITSGTGTEQTISEIESEKIPIYESQQDAESDLANLEEGQLYATKEDKFDVDDMKRYIRKQNVLSDYEVITFVNSSYTALYDGFINVEQQGNNDSLNIEINNDPILMLDNYNGLWQSTSFVVKKGDVVTITAGSVASNGYVKGAFYKLRDYTDR